MPRGFGANDVRTVIGGIRQKVEPSYRFVP
jgi:hypothetical protein